MNSSTDQDFVVERKINIVQGEQQVSNDPGVVLTTILGSCIAACMWDRDAGIGGMNHFLLPGDRNDPGQPTRGNDAMRYGAYSMELLINGLLRHGAQRRRLQAKLFGGSCMMAGLTDVGQLNAAFAERFLQAEGIAVVGGSLRGNQGRRIQFWPVSGRARQTLLNSSNGAVSRAEANRAPPPSLSTAGEVELF
ncbi:MAG: chemotaxis protein CheD [Acidiphilium sp. 37-64-53]|jgi:chemotaxis protein CheD|uniref:chemotaxis protein CheD n=1 Tax=Acidiphilium TaxID=522 RepID=UPI000BD90AAA|nr:MULTISPECIES: chemotaxis protein CheD [Acidiphilium]OYW02115.1 MAG: chemotaxis protein CheD [Acidiphilium sp. 37-64-53]OZB25202.1 MAG: chemotaxis protein CheD [Acidiphilium sp. 34-64-41]HQT84096.1 chemotaxis protein CheD [Acidiphilium rubrum]